MTTDFINADDPFVTDFNNYLLPNKIYSNGLFKRSDFYISYETKAVRFSCELQYIS